MIKRVRLAKELAVRVANKIGVLADLSGLLSDARVNIIAVAGYAKDDNIARIMLITADTRKAKAALRKEGYRSLKEGEVLVLELVDKPGALKLVTEKLALAGIDIRQIYGTTCSAGCPAQLVMTTSNNKKALSALGK